MLEWALERFSPRIALSTAFQIDGVALLDMAYELDPAIQVFSVDTGRLPAGDLRADRAAPRALPGTRARAALARRARTCRRWSAARARTSSTARSRTACSAATYARSSRSRGTSPTLDAWITGLRRDQWATRTDIRKVEIDHDHGAIVKLNPLAEWTEEEVWDYVRERDVPYHPLYDRGYTSIGCAPCTRAIAPGEAGRDGRWWWEAERARRSAASTARSRPAGSSTSCTRSSARTSSERAVRLARAGAGGRARRGAGGARARARTRSTAARSPGVAAIDDGRGRAATTRRRSRSCSSSASRAAGSARSTGPAASRPRSGSTGGSRAAPSSTSRAAR